MDLFAAAGVVLATNRLPSDAFDVGVTDNIAIEKLEVSDIRAALGPTFSSWTLLWSDPDGNSSATSTRDYVSLVGETATMHQTMDSPSHDRIGWLLVSESSAAVPEPSSFMLMCLGGFGWTGYRWVRKRKRASAAS